MIGRANGSRVPLRRGRLAGSSVAGICRSASITCPGVARKLYHARDLGEPFDFLT